jgi:hypothetical protein
MTSKRGFSRWLLSAAAGKMGWRRSGMMTRDSFTPGKVIDLMSEIDEET